MTFIKRGLFHLTMTAVGALTGYLLLSFTGRHVVVHPVLYGMLILLFMALSLGISILLVPRIFPLSPEAAVLPVTRKQNWAWLRPKGTGVRAGFPLNKDHVTIGREVKCAIMLNDASVSRQHSSITRLAEGYLVRDLGSSNGTFVNGQRIQEYLLQDGDRLSVGDVEFWFEAPLSDSKTSASHPNFHGVGKEVFSPSGGFSLDPSASGSAPLDDLIDDDEEGTEAWSPRPEQTT